MREQRPPASQTSPMTAPHHLLKEKPEIMATAGDVLATYYIDIKPRVVLDELAWPTSEPEVAEPQTGDRVRITEVNGGATEYVGRLGTVVSLFGDIVEVDIADGTSEPVYATQVEKVAETEVDPGMRVDTARDLTRYDLNLVDDDGDKLVVEGIYEPGSSRIACLSTNTDLGVFLTAEDIDDLIEYLTALKTIKEADA